MSEIFELIRADDAEGVRILLEREPDAASARDEGGVSALMQAAYRRNTEVVGAIRAASPPSDVFEAAALGDLERLDHDPNVYSADGFTPLHFAAMGGSAEAVRVLLEHGADPAAATDDGRTPRDLAETDELRALPG